jgi:hypothetical protein
LKQRFHALLGGKWNHMMDQTHIGYTSWQQPDVDTMPAVRNVLPSKGFGLSVEGDETSYPQAGRQPQLPELSAYSNQSRWIELFSHGTEPFSGEISCSQSWLHLRRERKADGDLRVWIDADWQQVPPSATSTEIIVNLNGERVTVTVPIHPYAGPVKGFVETDGCIAIEAQHFDKAVNSKTSHWTVLPNLGRTLGAVTPHLAPGSAKGGIRLEYGVHFFTKGAVSVKALLSPTQLLWPGSGLRYAISLDNEPPQIVNIHQGYTYFTSSWEQSVADNILVRETRHTITETGYHVLKYWAIDPGVVLQRIVIQTGPPRKSYLGPPESEHAGDSEAINTGNSNSRNLLSPN